MTLAFLARLSDPFNLVIVSNRSSAAAPRVRRHARHGVVGARHRLRPARPRPLPQAPHGGLGHYVAGPCGGVRPPFAFFCGDAAAAYAAEQALAALPEPCLVVMIGSPASGESRVAARLVAERGLTLVGGDAQGARHKQVFAAAFADRRSIVVDNTCPLAADPRASPAKLPPAATRWRSATSPRRSPSAST